VSFASFYSNSTAVLRMNNASACSMPAPTAGTQPSRLCRVAGVPPALQVNQQRGPQASTSGKPIPTRIPYPLSSQPQLRPLCVFCALCGQLLFKNAVFRSAEILTGGHSRSYHGRRAPSRRSVPSVSMAKASCVGFSFAAPDSALRDHGKVPF